GSVTDIVDSSGNLVQHYFYSSFGKINKIINSSGGDITANPIVNTCFTYTNREFDSESGLYFYRARYYEPTIGRFIQSDPHPGKLNFPNTLVNKYSYVNNNPLSLTDPSGRFFKQFFDDLGRMINGIGQAVLDLVNSEAFRVALIIAAAVVTG